jgi:hypothetical protein
MVFRNLAGMSGMADIPAVVTMTGTEVITGAITPAVTIIATMMFFGA